MPTRAADPLSNFNFLVETGGVLAAGFSEVTGMNAEMQVVEYREGRDPNANTRKLPGLAKYGNIMFKKGITTNLDFFNWFKSGIDGELLRIDLSILLLDELRQETVRFNVRQAWPVKFGAPDLKAAANEIAITSLEIAHEGLTIG
jgi:phage tail-like protein